MRNLKLTSPRMTGSDVSAWQRFLIAQSVFTGDVDGVFGPVTAESTRAYQTSRGMQADGIVGPGTFAQAVRDGFEAQPGRAAIAGLDANVDCTSFAKCIADAGLKFVVRYYASRASKTLMR